MKKKVTLSLESEVYKQFQHYCDDNDIQLSKRVERLIRHELEEHKKR